jgi:hypothetical protein
MGRLSYHVWVYVGWMVLLFGLQLRVVEAYVLTPDATRSLAEWFGTPDDSPRGALERLALQTDSVAHHQVRPPLWLGWAMLSAGAVMVTHGLILKRMK